MTFVRSKRIWLLLGLVIAALFFVRPGAQSIKSKIARSVGLALGRQVEISSASIRLLPHPGFELQNFVVHDDPSFSAEPMLRADDVTASLRLWSLLHGRLEIARLSLSDPSLNLVRNASGHWNLEQLLQRAADTAVAPTSKSRVELRPGFPYIEADSGRINLKIGQEKKPYAVTDADFSLWQESENSWGLRLKGRPVRTDFNLTNTGTIKLSGTWQRSSNLRDTPLQFALQWNSGQLGQITTLGYGNDKGWRGELDLIAQITGTPGDLHIRTNASVDDFRRYDITADSDLPLAAQCDAQYIAASQSLQDIHCLAPFQQGSLGVRGSIESLLGPRDYSLVWTADKIPMQSVAVLAARLRKDIPESLVASGMLNGTLQLGSAKASSQGPAALKWTGQGEVTAFHLGSSADGTDLSLGTTPFTIEQLPTAANLRRAPSLSAIPSLPGVEIGPVALHLGRPGAAVVHGWIAAGQFEFRLQGDAQLQRLLQVGHALFIPSLQTSAEGSTTVDLHFAGDWSDFSHTRVMGTAQLHSVRADIKGVDSPLEIVGANLSLTAADVNVQKLSASIAGIAWRGSMVLPRPCAVQGTCAVRFNLHAASVTDSELDSLLAGPSRYGRWYNLLTDSSASSFLAHLQADGRLSVDSVMLHQLAITDFAADASLNNGNLHLAQIRTRMLGGRQTGELTMDFTGPTPSLRASGSFDHIALEQLASFMQDDWITGSAEGTYEFSGSGRSIAKILASSTAESNVTARACVLPHISLAEEPLRTQRFDGDILFANGEFQIRQGTFETPEGTYEINGTASLARNISFRLTRSDGPEFNISGSLAQPRVVPSRNRVARVAPHP